MNDLFFHANTVKDNKSAVYLEESIENLNYYSAIEQLRLGCEMKSQEGIFSKKYDLKNISLERIRNNENPLFRMFSKVIELGDTQSDSIFFKLKEELISNVGKLKKQDAHRILLSLLNYAIRQTTKQEDKFALELFRLYQLGIEEKLLINNEDISNFTYLNIATTGAKLKEFEWTFKFINEYESFLKKETREDITTLAKSMYYFHKKDYEEVIETLMFYDFRQILLQINAKTLFLRAYFELFINDHSYFEMVMSSIDSFEKFIRRKGDLSDIKRKGYLNFIVILRKMTKYFIDNTKDGIVAGQIIKAINNSDYLFAGTWLKEKLK